MIKGEVFTYTFKMQSFNAVSVTFGAIAICASGSGGGGGVGWWKQAFVKPVVFWLPLRGVPVSAWERHLVGV